MEYLLTKKKVVDLQGVEHVANGIAVIENGLAIDIIADITVNTQLAENLIDILNKSEVSKYHYRDVIYDYIVEKY